MKERGNFFGRLASVLLCLLLLPVVAFPQTSRFASPSGSPSSDGSRARPWSIARALSACSRDTAIVLLDGVYLQDSTATWTVGRGAGRSRMSAEPGARPVFTRKNNQAPRIYTGGNTTLQGIWLGGRGVNDSIGTALGHGTARVPSSGDSIVACVFFNTWDNGIGTGSTKVVVKNCLFINAGMKSDQQYHGVYFSGQATAPESTLVAYRNVFITTDAGKFPASRAKWASHGYSLHYWHNPRYARIQKNFTTYWAVHQGKDVLLRDNVFWQGGIQFTTMEGIPHDSAAVDTPHVWRKNIIVKDVDLTRNENFSWPDPVAERGNPAFPEVMWWNGDSTWLSNQWTELGQGYVRKFGTVKRVRAFSFPGGVPAFLGASAASIDTAIARLGRSCYDRTAQAVYADTSILLNWQRLLDAVDFWQGTQEERVDVAGAMVSVPVSLTQGWNMIANPVVGLSDSVRQLFPTALSRYAFSFTSTAGYMPAYTLDRGRGYSAKFPAAGIAILRGAGISRDSIPVEEGWNMIGSISTPVDTASVVTIPTGLRRSMYFGYSGGFVPATRLEPGRGYWVKAGGAGAFVLDSARAVPAIRGSNTLDGFSTVTITDGSGAAQTLYLGEARAGGLLPGMFEMPPAAPEGVLDVRFTSGGMAEAYDRARAASFGIDVRDALSPLTVSWRIPPGAASLFLTAGNSPGRVLSGSGRVILAGPDFRHLLLSTRDHSVPFQYMLRQNYPNPFNASTDIAYVLPWTSDVSLKVFDILGREVAVLLSAEQPAGEYSVRFDAAGIGSGVYFYRLETRPVPDAHAGSALLTRKMILMK